MGFGEGMAQLKSVVICFTEFCVSSPNEREVKVVFGSANREIFSVIDLQR